MWFLSTTLVVVNSFLKEIDDRIPATSDFQAYGVAPFLRYSDVSHAKIHFVWHKSFRSIS